MLRDAVATALSRRTCVHLAIPVNVLSATSPLELKHFCASHANIRIQPRFVDTSAVEKAAELLIGSPYERPPKK
jgi:thiamine pyrophosphate-dependent acetolactate synthase large subunit-like protein